MPETARNVVLERIRLALRDLPQGGTVQDRTSDEVGWSAGQTIDSEATLALFEERLHDYDAAVERVSAGDVAAAVERILVEHSRPQMLVPPGFPDAWLPQGFAVEVDRDFSARELDAFGGVLTTAALGIAETGTVVLQGVPGQGRRAVSLVPDFHLCLLQARDVLASVPEAMVRLAATGTLPTTWISGPSATADIEMTRIKGVHGPRFLHVVLVA